MRWTAQRRRRRRRSSSSGEEFSFFSSIHILHRAKAIGVHCKKGSSHNISSLVSWREKTLSISYSMRRRRSNVDVVRGRRGREKMVMRWLEIRAMARTEDEKRQQANANEETCTALCTTTMILCLLLRYSFSSSSLSPPLLPLSPHTRYFSFMKAFRYSREKRRRRRSIHNICAEEDIFHLLWTQNESISILCEADFHFVDWMFFVHTSLHASLTLCGVIWFAKAHEMGMMSWQRQKDKKTSKILRKLIIRFWNSKSTNLLIPFWLTHLPHPSWPTKVNLCNILCAVYSNLLHFSVLWMNFFSSTLLSLCYNFFLCKYLTSLLSLHFSYPHSTFFPSFLAFFSLASPNSTPKIELYERRGRAAVKKST